LREEAEVSLAGRIASKRIHKSGAPRDLTKISKATKPYDETRKKTLI